jgi:hypothetical protein
MSHSCRNCIQPLYQERLNVKRLVSKPKGAAPEIQLLFAFLYVTFKPGPNLAMKMPSRFLGFHNSSFSQYSDVLGCVIFGNFEADGQFTDSPRTAQQFAHDLPPGFIH